MNNNPLIMQQLLANLQAQQRLNPALTGQGQIDPRIMLNNALLSQGVIPAGYQGQLPVLPGQVNPSMQHLPNDLNIPSQVQQLPNNLLQPAQVQQLGMPTGGAANAFTQDVQNGKEAIKKEQAPNNPNLQQWANVSPQQAQRLYPYFRGEESAKALEALKYNNALYNTAGDWPFYTGR